MTATSGQASGKFTTGDKTLETTIVGQIKNGFLARMARYSPPAIATWLVLAARANRRSQCYPSITKIQTDLGLARASVYKAIDELVKAGEIAVASGGGKGNPSNTYTVLGGPQIELVQNTDQFKRRTKVVQTTDKGGPQNELKPDTVTKHIKPDTSSCRKLRFDEADRATAVWMFSLIRILDEKAKQPNFDQWANDVRLMRERDDRTDADIRATFQWANADDFWRTNILSPGKLRDKFLQISLKMKAGSNGHANSNGKPRFRRNAELRSSNGTGTVGKF